MSRIEIAVDPDVLKTLANRRDHEKYVEKRAYRRQMKVMKQCGLKPIERRVIFLRFFVNQGKGYTFREIATIMSLPLASVHYYYNRSLEKYRRKMKKGGQPK